MKELVLSSPVKSGAHREKEQLLSSPVKSGAHRVKELVLSKYIFWLPQLR